VDLVGGEATLVLTIHDNGKGIDPTAAQGPHALGILSMRQRVHLLAGSWRMHGERGKGTTIEVEVPWKPPATVDLVPGQDPS
jgi:signal transduction histidine kinase